MGKAMSAELDRTRRIGISGQCDRAGSERDAGT